MVTAPQSQAPHAQILVDRSNKAEAYWRSQHTPHGDLMAGMWADINRPDAAKKAEKKQEKRRLGWWRTRIGALNKVYGGPRRYGDGKLYQFSDDDAGREDLRILLDHYCYSNPAAMPRIIKARAPWLTEPERGSLMEQIGRFSRYWDSPALAAALNLTEAERKSLGGVPTIGAVDVTPAERKEMRKQSNTERRRQKRRAAGMKSQADSISRAKPWEQENMSRRTWYRRGGTTLSAVKLSNTADIPVPREPSRSAGCQHGRDTNVSPFIGKPKPTTAPATYEQFSKAA